MQDPCRLVGYCDCDWVWNGVYRSKVRVRGKNQKESLVVRNGLMQGDDGPRRVMQSLTYA